MVSSARRGPVSCALGPYACAWADSVALRGGLDTRPESGGGVHQPEVHIAMIGKGGEYAQVIRVQPRRSEYRHALREVAALRLALEPGQSGSEALHRARHSKLVAQPAPELGLPGSIGRQH